MRKRFLPLSIVLLLMISILTGTGCKSVSVTEVRGKTQFGPEFRNFGTNTHDIRYYLRQRFEAKLSNNWTAGVMYQRRDLDGGAGDNENLVLFEIGYPLGKPKKKPEKTAEEMRLEQLEKELHELNNELAQAESDYGSIRLAKVEMTKSEINSERINNDAQP